MPLDGSEDRCSIQLSYGRDANPIQTRLSPADGSRAKNSCPGRTISRVVASDFPKMGFPLLAGLLFDLMLLFRRMRAGLPHAFAHEGAVGLLIGDTDNLSDLEICQGCMSLDMVGE